MPLPLLYYPEGTAGAGFIFANFRKLETRSYRKNDLESVAKEGPEILIANTRLPINSETFLRFPSVKIFATVSSGTDHVNVSDLKKAGRIFLNSPGCNAGSVGEYCWVGIRSFFSTEDLRKKKIGLVGFGNTGKAFAKILSSYGIGFVYSDPYIKEASVSLSEVCDCEIISFHVPLTFETPYPTSGMFTKTEAIRLQSGALVLNTSRGEILNREAFEEIISREDISKVIDVFDPEPPKGDLIRKLSQCSNSIFTPHIAGYSQLGRLLGTYRLAEKLCILYKDGPLPPIENFLIADSDWKTETFLEKEDGLLREAWSLGDWEYFERRRNDYPIRLDMGLV